MSTRSTIRLDLHNWTRLPEVIGYAEHRGISVRTAILELVNHGLSHLDDGEFAP